MIFWNSDETKEELKKGGRNLLYQLDHQVFGTELVYSSAPEVISRQCHPMAIYSTAMSDDKSRVLSYFAITIVTERYYRGLLSGNLKEEAFEPWSYESGQTPLLFLQNLVIGDRRAAPYVFRRISKELLALCQKHDIYLHRVFAIASHWVTKRALINYQFEQVGTYQAAYPILMASRDKSPVFNSFMKQY